MITFRDLRADEIDCRVARCTEKGAQLLLYKDARADMIILDEQIGPENWQREHYECKGNLFCRVGIKSGNEWIWKSDCGAESNTEKLYLKTAWLSLMRWEHRKAVLLSCIQRTALL